MAIVWKQDGHIMGSFRAFLMFWKFSETLESQCQSEEVIPGQTNGLSWDTAVYISKGVDNAAYLFLWLILHCSYEICEHLSSADGKSQFHDILLFVINTSTCNKRECNSGNVVTSTTMMRAAGPADRTACSGSNWPVSSWREVGCWALLLPCTPLFHPHLLLAWLSIWPPWAPVSHDDLCL